MRPIAALIALVLAFQLSVSQPTPVNVQNIGGSTVGTAATGVQKVGISGNAAATLDAAITTGAAPTNAIWLTQAPATASAAACTTKFQNASGAAVVVKASAGNLFGFSITNETAAVAYIEFFNIATTPVLGTTAVALAIKLPASANITLTGPGVGLMNFTTGIGFAVTTLENGTIAASVTGGIFYV